MHEQARWIEAHQAIVALAIFGGPFAIAWLLKRAGVSSGWADLTHLVLGVGALIAVVVIMVRGRRPDSTG